MVVGEHYLKRIDADTGEMTTIPVSGYVTQYNMELSQDGWVALAQTIDGLFVVDFKKNSVRKFDRDTFGTS